MAAPTCLIVMVNESCRVGGRSGRFGGWTVCIGTICPSLEPGLGQRSDLVLSLAQGDLVLPAGSTHETLTFGLWSMAFGSYMIMASDTPLGALGIDHPRAALCGNYHALLDGDGQHRSPTGLSGLAYLHRPDRGPPHQRPGL
jgi:hypothetical protein